MTAWTAFYWDDYVGDTQDLSLVEHGAYIKLLAAYYAGDGHLSADARRLYRVCGAFDPDEQAAVDAIADRYFHVQEGRLRHSRADREIARANAKSEAAKKANAARWESDRSPTGVRPESDRNPSGVQAESSPQPQTEPQGQTEHTATADPVDPESNTDKGERLSRSKKSSAKSQGTRIPDDWELTEDRAQYARGQGLTDEQIQLEFEKFRDYWTAQPGQKGRKADWDATWRNWIRRAAEQQQQRVTTAVNGSIDHTSEAWQRLLQHCRQGHSNSDVRREDPALAAAAEQLGGMGKLRRLTERDLEFRQREFRSLYRPH